MRSRTASCAVASTTGRRSAKLRRSPFTAYWRAGNVTFRPLPTATLPDAEADQLQAGERRFAAEVQLGVGEFPAGLPRSFGVILTVMVFELWLVCIVLLLVGNRDWFLHVR